MGDKGWFRTALRPEGDRDAAEQLKGLELALSQASGKTVLDLGCAEAVISREFALAGAAEVLGIELLESHLRIGREVCKDVPQVRLLRASLLDHIKQNPEPQQFDIVLALAICHKLPDPSVPLRFAARSAKDLLLFRDPKPDGIIRSKHTKKPCNVPKVMLSLGFREEAIFASSRGERVQYWRRNGLG